jgi:2-dehydropantoate 2-reductase
MKILIYGGDVVGSIYAARLHGPKHDVTILAAGDRLADLQQHGVVLRHAITGDELFLHVHLIEGLSRCDHYDLALVTVPSYDLPDLPSDLICNREIGTLLVMTAHFGACESWHNILKRDRVVLGCPGFAGIMTGPKVQYLATPLLLQRATIGALDNHAARHLRTAMNMFRQAGLYVSTSAHIDALLATQASVFVSLAAALRVSQSLGVRTGYSLETARMVVRSVRECFAVLAQLQVPVTPRYVKWLSCVPSKYLTDLLFQWSRTLEFNLMVAAQLTAAGDEIAHLAEQLRLFSTLASVETPAFDELAGYLAREGEAEPYASAHTCAS